VLDDYPVVAEVVVRWGDIDLLGHVNNIKYLQYFESARVEYLMRAGMEAPGKAWREFGFILAAVDCRYKAPVTFPDTISVGARVKALGEERLVIRHAAYSHKLGRLAAEGDAHMVAYDYSAGRRTVIPADLRAAILALEDKELPVPSALNEMGIKP
jgi:acyl-CoA thioester hydrolase